MDKTDQLVTENLKLRGREIFNSIVEPVYRLTTRGDALHRDELEDRFTDFWCRFTKECLDFIQDPRTGYMGVQLTDSEDDPDFPF